MKGKHAFGKSQYTFHEAICNSKLKYKLHIDIMRQYSNFQNLGSQKRFFRDKINQGILSHFEAEDQIKIEEKVENLKIKSPNMLKNQTH